VKTNHTQSPWKAMLDNVSWKVLSSENRTIASVEKSGQDEADAKLIAASPIMLEALSGLVQLIGDEDLPDNGELSGAAICDLARSAIALAVDDENWPFS